MRGIVLYCQLPVTKAMLTHVPHPGVGIDPADPVKSSCQTTDG